MKSLLADCKFLLCSPATVAGTSDLDGTVIDMSQDGGYDGVCFVAQLGDVTSTSVLELQGQGSAAADGSSPSTEATTGTKTAGATDCDNKFLVLDLSRPANRYVFSRVKRGTANAVVNSVLAILYKGRSCPVTQGSDVIKSAFANVK